MNALGKKVLLIKPDYQYWPIGFAYVARSLVENGIEFDLVDTSVNANPNWNTILRKGDYGAVATGGLIGNYTFFKNTFKATKEFDSSLPCILGGNATTDSKPEILFSTMPVDYLVIGEAEYTFPHLLKTLDEGDADPATVDGIILRGADGKIVRTQRRPRVDLIATNWMPYWDCLDVQYYLSKFQHIPVMTGRGCTGRCTFCSPTNGQYMGRAVSHTIDEIKYLISRYEIGSFAFLNEIFFPDDESILEFCKQYKEIEPRRPWGCLMRADMNADVLKEMKDAGCRGPCNIGLESGSDRVLKLINKEVTVEQIRSFVKTAQQVDLPLEASFMMANYGETAEDIKATVDLLIELKAAGPMALTINYPGTANYRQALRRGLIRDEVQYLESMDKLYSRNYYQVISDHLSGELDYLNLSAMPTDELFRTVEKEMRRYYTDFEIENAKTRLIEGGAWEFVGNCTRCGGEVKNTVPPVSLNYPFNRALSCPRCGVIDNYFSPFLSRRYKSAFEPVAKAIQNAKRIVVFGFAQEFYDFFRYDLFGINYDAIIGIVGHSGSWLSAIPPLQKGYILNHPILSIDEISRLNPDLLIVPGGFIPAEIRRELYTKCPNLVEQQVSLSLPEHRLFTDSMEYRTQTERPGSLSSPEPAADLVECRNPAEQQPTLSLREHDADLASRQDSAPQQISLAMPGHGPVADSRKDGMVFALKVLALARKTHILRAVTPFVLRTLQSVGYTVVNTKALEAERAAARDEIARLIDALEAERSAASATRTERKETIAG